MFIKLVATDGRISEQNLMIWIEIQGTVWLRLIWILAGQSIYDALSIGRLAMLQHQGHNDI